MTIIDLISMLFLEFIHACTWSSIEAFMVGQMFYTA